MSFNLRYTCKLRKSCMEKVSQISSLKSQIVLTERYCGNSHFTLEASIVVVKMADHLSLELTRPIFILSGLANVLSISHLLHQLNIQT